MSQGTNGRSGQRLDALMSDYIAGHPGSFRALHREVGPDLYNYLYGLCGQNSRLAHALLKQTFLEIHRTQSDYLDSIEPMQWFQTIADRCFKQVSPHPERHERDTDTYSTTLSGRLRSLWRREPARSEDRPDQSTSRVPRLVPT